MAFSAPFPPLPTSLTTRTPHSGCLFKDAKIGTPESGKAKFMFSHFDLTLFLEEHNSCVSCFACTHFSLTCRVKKRRATKIATENFQHFPSPPACQQHLARICLNHRHQPSINRVFINFAKLVSSNVNVHCVCVWIVCVCAYVQMSAYFVYWPSFWKFS